MGQLLQQPARPRFTTPYALPKHQLHKNQKTPRLGDYLMEAVPAGSPHFFDMAAETEFVVIDTVTKEKAWFEIPEKATIQTMQSMIESHFGVSAHRVDAKLWFV